MNLGAHAGTSARLVPAWSNTAQEWLAGLARARYGLPDAGMRPKAPLATVKRTAAPPSRLVGGTDTLRSTTRPSRRSYANSRRAPGFRPDRRAGREVSVKLARGSRRWQASPLGRRRGLRQLVASPRQMAALAADRRLVL